MLKRAIGAAALASALLSSAALAQDKIKVGVTATLEGTYTLLGEDGIRGFKVALKHYGGKVGDNASDLGIKIGDKELEFVVASTDATPDSAVRAVRKLVEQDKAQILISPLSGDEGIAVKNFSQDPPGIDVHQRRLRGSGDDFPRSVAELLPLQYGRRPMADRIGQIRLR